MGWESEWAEYKEGTGMAKEALVMFYIWTTLSPELYAVATGRRV